MKKHLFNLRNFVLVLATSWLSLGSIAQMQIGNSDFEAFSPSSGSSTRPVNWNNMKNGNLCGFCSLGSIQTTWQSPDIRPGSPGVSSVLIKSGSAIGKIINGNVTTGKLYAPSTTPSEGYNVSVLNNTQFSEVMTDKPDSIVFWAKYTITSAADSARVSAIIHDNFALKDPQDGASAPHVVGKAIKNFQTNANWVRMSIPFNYSGPSTDAQYILVTLTSSHKPGLGVDGATLYVDDLELIYNQNELYISPIANQNIFENQSGTVLTANETPKPGSSVTSRQWKSSATLGGPYNIVIPGATNSTYTPQFANAGTYYVVCETNFNGDIVTSNEVKIVVNPNTVAIAPASDQTTVQNQNGTPLTATESSVADSRRWKYGAALAGPFATTIAGQTGLTYTPNFSVPGTYYVICESTFGTVVKNSNPVKIVVTPYTVVIAPNAVQNLITNQQGTLLTVTENAPAVSRIWKSSMTSGGPYVNIAGATGTTYTPQFSIANTYFVICETSYSGGTIASNEVKVVVSDLTANIAPGAAQNLVEDEPGFVLTVTENTTGVSRQWKSSTTSGGTYTAIAGQTGATYIPVFSTVGTYYVVCESSIYGNTVTSNEITIVVSPFEVSIAPSATQNLVEGQAGITLTATENASGASRQWMIATSPGGTPVAIAGQTGLNYTPQFATAGTYYVTCESVAFGHTALSNQVEIIVVVPTVNVASISPNSIQSLIENQMGAVISVSEIPGAANSREWQYTTTSGSGYSSFTTAETGTSYTPQFTIAGTYYVVCISDFGGGDIVTSNEVQINVVEFVTSIAPLTSQNLIETEIGTELTVTESPTADSREWKYTTTSGSGYVSFATAETGTSYTPQFANTGTYYIVCESEISGITTISNEVEINVLEFNTSINPIADQILIETEVGTELAVVESPTPDSREWKFSTTSGSGYVSFATAETGATYTPQFANAGTYYIVCDSELNGVTSRSNEVKIEVVVFINSINPAAAQTILEMEAGALLTVTETPTADSREWKFTTTSGAGYASFATAETGTTYTPEFVAAGTYYVVCESVISGITTLSNEVIIFVDPLVGVSKDEMPSFSVYASNQILNVDFSKVEMDHATLKVLTVEGKVVAQQNLESKQMNSIQLSVPTGVYFFSISNGTQFYQGKVFIKN